ncbi:hypothetical protein [Streptomyces sp. NPDC051636]|uniref:hypothetical protein n=1 Tax=Streptomyces sp. NPDC051636 TaxID=3365663 RepID=UPI00379765AA
MPAPTPDGERPTPRTLAPALALTGVVSALVVVTAVVLRRRRSVPRSPGGASAAALVLCAAVATAVPRGVRAGPGAGWRR